MTASNAITDLLAAPLGSEWTIEGLAEQLLGTIAAMRSNDVYEVAHEAEAGANPQIRRLLRPLLACLATKSAAEAGTAPNLHGGDLSFLRAGPDGPVWILGQFENRPGVVHIRLRRLSSTGLPPGMEPPPQPSERPDPVPPSSSITK